MNFWEISENEEIRTWIFRRSNPLNKRRSCCQVPESHSQIAISLVSNKEKSFNSGFK